MEDRDTLEELFETKWQENHPDEIVNTNDELLDEDKYPLENFLSEMEKRLSWGQSQWAVRNWARKSGVDKATFDSCLQLIRTSWRLEGTTTFVMQQRKDELRCRYNAIFRREMEKEDRYYNGKIAIAACDSMAKLDGLLLPDIQINVNSTEGPATAAELTNRTRARVQELMVKMNERASQRSATVTNQLLAAKAKDANPVAEEQDPLEVPSPMVMRSVK